MKRNLTITRMLRSVFNKKWPDHPTNDEIYGNILPTSNLIRETRVRFDGHCFRSKETIVGNAILWKPNHGKKRSCQDLIKLTLTS